MKLSRATGTEFALDYGYFSDGSWETHGAIALDDIFKDSIINMLCTRRNLERQYYQLY